MRGKLGLTVIGSPSENAPEGRWDFSGSVFHREFRAPLTWETLSAKVNVGWRTRQRVQANG